jgi:hypothetical protein
MNTTLDLGLPLDRLIAGDCCELLRTVPTGSIDLETIREQVG